MTRQHAHVVPHRTRLQLRRRNSIGIARNKLSHDTLPAQNISEPRRCDICCMMLTGNNKATAKDVLLLQRPLSAKLLSTPDGAKP